VRKVYEGGDRMLNMGGKVGGKGKKGGEHIREGKARNRPMEGRTSASRAKSRLCNRKRNNDRPNAEKRGKKISVKKETAIWRGFLIGAQP